jgi:hypothetical protein
MDLGYIVGVTGVLTVLNLYFWLLREPQRLPQPQ